MTTRSIHAVVLVLALSPRPGRGSQREQPLPANFPASASAVVLDVVVRDGKGHAVRALTADEFEVYEDGARQPLQGFEVVDRDARPSTAPAAAGRLPGATEAVSPQNAAPTADAQASADGQVIAFVFDRLSAGARSVAQRAAISALGRLDPLQGRAAVFAIDTSLRTLQPYTADARLVRQGLDRAASLATSSFTPQSKTNPSTADLLTALIPRETARVEGADSAIPVVADDVMGELDPMQKIADPQVRLVQVALARSLRRMEASYETLAREQQGYATTNALLAVVSSMAGLPGRKSVVFFSEGLALPPAVQGYLQSVVDSATRAGVSVYCVDTAGLRVTSTLADSRSEIQSYSARKERSQEGGSGIALKELEINEDALRRDPQAALGALAEGTGGLLIRDSNDLGAGLRTIDGDMRFYYVLTYAPANQDYDGRFRQIEVKVRRKGLHVRTRKGYYALKAGGPDPTLPHEVSALAQLERRPQPHAFPVRVAALSFPEPGGGQRAPVLVSVPARGLAYKVDGESYHAEFVIVARIKTAEGDIVRKLSQPYHLRGPIGQLQAARAADVLFYRETRLPPGRFTVEAVVYDSLAREAAVRETELLVPADGPGAVRTSSLVIVRAADRVTSGQQTAGAMTIGDVVLYPSVEEPVSRSRPLLTFFFTACVPAGSLAPAAQVELLRTGQLVNLSSVSLPAPDANGCLRHLAGIPMEGLETGPYELKLVVGTDDRAVARSARFELVE